MSDGKWGVPSDDEPKILGGLDYDNDVARTRRLVQRGGTDMSPEDELEGFKILDRSESSMLTLTMSVAEWGTVIATFLMVGQAGNALTEKGEKMHRQVYEKIASAVKPEVERIAREMREEG